MCHLRLVSLGNVKLFRLNLTKRPNCPKTGGWKIECCGHSFGSGPFKLLCLTTAWMLDRGYKECCKLPGQVQLCHTTVLLAFGAGWWITRANTTTALPIIASSLSLSFLCPSYPPSYFLPSSPCFFCRVATPSASADPACRSLSRRPSLLLGCVFASLSCLDSSMSLLFLLVSYIVVG